MPTTYVVALLALVLVIAAARLVSPVLPLRGVTVRLGAADVVLAVVALVGLAFHCGAMFYRPLVQALPGTRAAIVEINALGAASMVVFAIPSLLIMLALRHLSLPPLAAIALALTAVGITMYDGGSLTAHLTAIFAAISLLAFSGAALLAAPLPPATTSGR